MLNLPTLYKRSKAGKLQLFDIQVTSNTYTVTWGYVDGKEQSKTTTALPKNIGRSNATTDEEQALLEAKALHAKKIKLGYTTSQDTTSTRHQAMKISKWPPKKMPDYPLYVQIKYNGLNATYKRTNNTLQLLSRTGEEYPILPENKQEVLDLMDKLQCNELVGELWADSLSLQEIVSYVKKPKEFSNIIRFMLFDIGDLPIMNFQNRWKYLTDNVIFAYTHILPAYTKIVNNETELAEFYYSTIRDDYEGIVIKHPEAEYRHGVRSNQMWKLKPVQSTEVKILDYNLDKNDHPVFIVEYNDKQFKTKPKGTDVERKQIVKDFDKLYRNNYGTIEYEMLSDGGIPTKPIFISLRKCDNTGEPLE